VELVAATTAAEAVAVFVFGGKDMVYATLTCGDDESFLSSDSASDRRRVTQLPPFEHADVTAVAPLAWLFIAVAAALQNALFVAVAAVT